MDNSNTVPKQLKPFVKGDPRINRKGRPKSFDALRELALQISHEPLPNVVIEGHKVTVAEAILRQWAQSKNPIMQRGFLEIAFGKVPDKVDFPDVLRVLVEYADDKAEAEKPTPSPSADK